MKEKDKQNNSKIKKILYIIHEVIFKCRPIIILGIIILIPIIYVLYIFNVNRYIVPELIQTDIVFSLDIYYRYFLVILAVMHFYEIIYNRKKPNISDLFLYLFLIMTIVSTFFAYDLETALYGFPYRNEGVYTLLFYGFLYLNCKEINNEKYVLRMSRIIIFYAFIHLYAVVLQITGIFENVFFKYNTDDAIGLTDNCNFLGSLMCMLSMITSAAFILKIQKRSIYYLIFFIISYVTLLFANSTGPFISFVFTFVLFIVYGLVKKCLVKKNAIIITLLILVLYPVVLSYKDDITTEIKSNVMYFVNKFQGENKNDTSDKMEGLTGYQLGHGRIRIWTNVWKVVKESPWIGYGPDNLAYPYYDMIEQHRIVDKAHNVYLHIWSSSGIFALIGYLGLVILNIKDGFKSKNPLVICLLFGIIAYSVQATFNINANEVTPFFYIFMGFMVGLVNKKEETLS